MPAREIMPSAVVRVDPATPVREGIALLTERSVAASPVVDSENQVIGFTDHSGCRDRWTISGHRGSGDGHRGLADEAERRVVAALARTRPRRRRRRLPHEGRGNVRVLLAVATRHGATREIAEQVALAMTSALNEADVRADVDVLDVAHVTAVTGYDAVVLGSAVYIGHWLEAARHLAREHRDKWRRVPV